MTIRNSWRLFSALIITTVLLQLIYYLNTQGVNDNTSPKIKSVPQKNQYKTSIVTPDMSGEIDNAREILPKTSDKNDTSAGYQFQVKMTEVKKAKDVQKMEAYRGQSLPASRIHVASNFSTTPPSKVRSNLTLKISDSSQNAQRYTRIDDAHEESFQRIDNKEAWLYSVYLDEADAKSGRKMVRAFGVVKTEFLKPVFCLFTLNGTTLTSKGRIRALPDSHKMGFVPCELECILKDGVYPKTVSFTFDLNRNVTNEMHVVYPKPRIRNVTVCYAVLHSKFNRTSQLIQSIEMNRLLGAEHFMIYNYSISPETDQLLRWYQAKGLLTVLQWPLPTLKSWYFGQMTAINDCFFRNRNVSQFVVMVDTDEIIVPLRHKNWLDLIESLERQHNGVNALNENMDSDINPPHKDQFRSVNKENSTLILSNAKINSSQKLADKSYPICSFLFRSSFFDISPSSDNKSLIANDLFNSEQRSFIKKYNIYLLSKLSRENRIFPHKVRSKFIARPECVRMMGIHRVLNFTGKFTDVRVSEDLAIIHHYRVWPRGNSVIDSSILRFKDSLYSCLKIMFKQFEDVCNCIW